MYEEQLCQNEAPSLGIFDFSVAPPLLYYSYVPIIVISLLLGVFILKRDKFSLISKCFFGIASFFSLWALNAIVQWIASYHTALMFAWQLNAFLELPIFIFSIYFVYAFVNGKDLPFKWKAALASVFIATCGLLPTSFNIVNYDISTCEGTIGYLWNVIYSFEALSIFVIIGICVAGLRNGGLEVKKKKAIKVLLYGMVIFLAVFAISNIYGDIIDIYDVTLVGPIGMVVFIALLSYMIVQYRIFNVKVIGTQVLILGLVSLIGSQLFFVVNRTNQILTVVTLMLSVMIGYFLVKSVKREIEARTLIEKQKGELEVANARLKELDKQKTEFVSFATHQLRSPLAAMKGNTSLILEGDYGPIGDGVRSAVETIQTSAKTLATVVEDYLNISRIELGTMKYDMRDMDFKDMVKEVVNEQKPNINAKGLAFTVSIDESQAYKIKADPDKFKQVVMNTIDNSVKYTPQGSLSISLVKDPVKGVVRLKIADTGVGIRADVMPKLFQKFSRAPHANEANIHGTGLGLYIAKQIMDAHNGRIWAESEGEGKGSQFYIELPEAK